MRPRFTRVALAALCLGCYAQDRTKNEIDDHQAERQEWFYSQREFPLGHIPAGARINAIAAIKQIERAARQSRPLLRATSRPADAATWSLIGPQPTDSGTPYVTAGRVNAIAIDPRDNNTVYIGAAEGGVWKTIDGGVNWTPLTDDQPSLANGAVVLDPSNPDTVYVGTGEENFAQDSYYGAGILKSTDAGQTWTNIVGPFLHARIGSISVHPSNGKILLCTSDTGAWRSTDAGNTWIRVLGGVATSVTFDPSNGDVAYLALGSPSGDPTNGVYKSTDAGLTWTRSSGSGANSIATKNMGRIQLAIAASDTSTLFASVANASSNGLLGIWKSTDGAQTWNQLAISSSLASAWGTQMWYDNTIAVSPTDPNVIIAGGVGLFRSVDGGATWSQLPYLGANGVDIHVDQHFIAFTPDGTKVFIANDGGVYQTTNVTDAVKWTTLNQTLALTQFYPGLSVNPSDPTIAIGGTQDNGTQRFSGYPNWNNVACGDGGFTAIDASAPNIAFGACQDIAINVTSDGFTFLPAEHGIDQTDRTQFIAPLVIDPSNPQNLYFGTFRLWRSTDAAGNWTPLSGDLTGGHSTIKAVAVAPSDTNTIYVGTTDALVKVTRNAGNSPTPDWTDASHGLPIRVITHIAVDPIDPAIAYVTFSGFPVASDLSGHILRTRDGGKSWTSMNGNLPNIPVNDLIVDPDIPGTFYAATDAGVMVSSDDGTTWNSLGSGLPRVVVHSIALHRSARLLFAATHGRSVWQLPVALAGSSAQPSIASIKPSTANAGSDQFTIAITGSNFGPNTVVRWNGQPRSTSFVDSGHLQVTIPASDIAVVGRASISAFDPGTGAGTSNSVAFTIGPAPVSASNAVVSAAFPLGGNNLGQRSIASLYGANMANITMSAGLPPLPFALGGTSLTIGGNPVPLFYVSPGFINFQVPFLAVSRATTVPMVITQGLLSTTINVTVTQYSPGIFTQNSQGSGQASALIANTSSLAAPVGFTSNSRPIMKGEYLSIYCTGLGDVRNRPTLGQPTPSSPLAPTLVTPTVTLGGQLLDPSAVSFSGLAPGFAGLYLVNVKIPASAPSGDAVPLSLNIAGFASNTVTVAIQ